jgi:hypothetical protein
VKKHTFVWATAATVSTEITARVFIIVDDGGRVNEWTGFCGCDDRLMRAGRKNWNRKKQSNNARTNINKYLQS